MSAASAPSRRRPTRGAVRQALRNHARDMADAMLELLDGMGLFDEPDVEREPGTAPRVRRSSGALSELSERILEALRSHRGPVAISELALQLDVAPRTIAHPLASLVAGGLVRKSGERRGTRYRAVPRRRSRRARG